MKLHLLAALPVLAGSLCAAQIAQVGAVGTVMDAAACEQFAKKVQEAAVLWDKDDPNDPLGPAYKTSAYGAAAFAAFKQAAERVGGSTGPFEAAHLLAPLANSDVELIRQALPVVRTLLARQARYRPLPTYPEGALRSLRLPDRAPKMPAEQSLKILADQSEAREKKLSAESAVIRHNRQVKDLEGLCMALLLKAGQTKDDDLVVAALLRLEKEGVATYQGVAEAIKLQAGSLDRKRALKMYDGLLEPGKRLELVESNYMDPTEARIYPDQNSTFSRPRCQPGRDILDVVNALAGPAGKPAVPVPSEEEVTASTGLGLIKARLTEPRPDVDQIKKGLEDLIKRYPKTNAAKEARDLLAAKGRRR